MSSKSSISAGYIIRKLLSDSEEVKNHTRKIYPVVVDDARLPYIVYRRSGMKQETVKTGRGADTILMQVICYTADYDSGVALAEAVRDAIDNQQGEFNGLVMRSCYLSDCTETWLNDAYAQNLIFTIKL